MIYFRDINSFRYLLHILISHSNYFSPTTVPTYLSLSLSPSPTPSLSIYIYLKSFADFVTLEYQLPSF